MNKIIDKTESLSPLTSRRVDAFICENNSGVSLEKADESGRNYSVLLEPDVSLYNLLSSKTVSGRKHYTVYASADCNLKCQFCYESSSCVPVSPKSLQEFLRDKTQQHIILGGREPTCNPQLPELIRIVARRNYACIITNGLRLADYGYLQELKRCGLKLVHFSLNGLHDSIYSDSRMNGQPLLKEKIAALENIRKARIRASIGITVVKGLNEGEIREVFNYCCEHTDFIEELRIRAAVPYNPEAEGSGEGYYRLSDLIHLFCSASKVDKRDIIGEVKFIKALKNLWPSIKGIQHCGLWFHYDVKQKQALFKGNECETADCYSTGKIAATLIQKYGLSYIAGCLDIFRYSIFSPLAAGSSRILRIQIRCWPNIYSIDLNESHRCLNYYFKDNKLTPFCFRHILDRTEGYKENSGSR